ncbi:MAG: D-aminoacyl-tRNA deacylase [Candidatus Micrarchaeia archaeon]
MDLNKFSIIFSSSDIAGRNIARMIAEAGYGQALCELPENILYKKFDDNSGPYIVLSRHSSEKKIRAITCHFTGNWSGEAKYGGNPRDVCIAMPSVMKGVAQYISGKINTLTGYVFTLEVTHHGPTGNFPMMFVEIGSCEEDWGNTQAAGIIADALLNAKESEDGEVVIGVGGPHYAPDFTRLLDKYRIAHIIPQYAVDGLALETFRMGIERSTERVEKVLIAWKGLTAAQREKIIGFCNECDIGYIKYK